jgi:diguanylate cyclase (GGDEF)-like protein
MTGTLPSSHAMDTGASATTNRGRPIALEGPVTPARSTNAGGRFRSRLDLLIRFGCVLVSSVAIAVLCGWIFGIPRLTQLLPDLAFMKVNTASALLTASIALWLLHTREPGSPWIPFARCLAVLLLALGSLTLSEHIFGLELGIDQHISTNGQLSPQSAHLGRVSPASSFILTFVGLALLTLKARRSILAACTHWLIVPPLLVSALAVLGYLYGATSLYAVKPYASMAAHTAASFFVLSLCILAADSAHGFARIATSDTAGGLVSRRLLPTIPIIIFLLGWVGGKGQELGFYDAQFGSALMVLLSVTFCVTAVAWTGISLHRVDVTRKVAEAEIVRLNVGLELRVQERTNELAQVSAQLVIVNGSLELLSRQDGLTGLANRRHFDTYLADQLRVAHRQKRAISLVLVDVDAFKAYNDLYGHQAGDDCLKAVAVALRSCCRQTADMAARYGGEEFAMILPETDRKAAVRVAERVRAAVARLNITHQKSPAAPFVTVSAGISAYSQDGAMNADQLIRDADQALYQAKRLGRNQIVAATIGVPDVGVV